MFRVASAQILSFSWTADDVSASIRISILTSSRHHPCHLSQEMSHVHQHALPLSLELCPRCGILDYLFYTGTTPIRAELYLSHVDVSDCRGHDTIDNIRVLTVVIRHSSRSTCAYGLYFYPISPFVIRAHSARSYNTGNSLTPKVIKTPHVSLSTVILWDSSLVKASLTILVGSCPIYSTSIFPANLPDNICITHLRQNRSSASKDMSSTRPGLERLRNTRWLMRSCAVFHAAGYSFLPSSSRIGW